MSQMILFGETDGFTSGCSIRWPSFLMVSCHVFVVFVIVVVRGQDNRSQKFISVIN